MLTQTAQTPLGSSHETIWWFHGDWTLLPIDSSLANNSCPQIVHFKSPLRLSSNPKIIGTQTLSTLGALILHQNILPPVDTIVDSILVLCFYAPILFSTLNDHVLHKSAVNIPTRTPSKATSRYQIPLLSLILWGNLDKTVLQCYMFLSLFWA
jgi:hypothetical protein